MDHQPKEDSCTIKRHAYHKGYIDGYRCGVEDSKSGAADSQIASGFLDQPIQFLDLSTRPFNCLDRSGYKTIRDIISLNKDDICKIRGLGSKGIQEIAQALWNCSIRHSDWYFWLYSD